MNVKCRDIYPRVFEVFNIDPADCFFQDELSGYEISVYGKNTKVPKFHCCERVYVIFCIDEYNTKPFKCNLDRENNMFYLDEKKYCEFRRYYDICCKDAKFSSFIFLSKENQGSDKSKNLIEPQLQSWRDNANILFILDTKTNVLHDKSCEELNHIPIENLKPFDGYLFDIDYCKNCRDRLHIRLACIDDFKHFAAYKSFLTRGGLTEEQIEEYIRHRDFKMKLRVNGDMQIKVNEDTWIIKKKNDRNYTLMHNNYTVLDDGKRVINQGANEKYHLQYKAKKLVKIFDTICKYSFDEMHLGMEDEGIPLWMFSMQ